MLEWEELRRLQELICLPKMETELRLFFEAEALPVVLPNLLTATVGPRAFTDASMEIWNPGEVPLTCTGWVAKNQDFVVFKGLREDVYVSPHSYVNIPIVLRSAGKTPGKYRTDVYFAYKTSNGVGKVSVPVLLEVQTVERFAFDFRPAEILVDADSRGTVVVEYANCSDVQGIVYVDFVGFEKRIDSQALTLPPACSRGHFNGPRRI